MNQPTLYLYLYLYLFEYIFLLQIHPLVPLSVNLNKLHSNILEEITFNNIHYLAKINLKYAIIHSSNDHQQCDIKNEMKYEIKHSLSNISKCSNTLEQ